MLVKIWGAIIVSSLAWGTTGVATRAALTDGIPPVAMTAIRAVLATVVLYLILVVRRHRLSRDGRTWRLGAIAGLFQLATPFVLFTLAYQYASAGFIGLIVALIPLATALVAHYLLDDEPIHTAKASGLVIALAGVAFLLLSGDSGLDEGGRPMLAAMLGVGAVVSIAVSSVIAKARAGSYDPIELTWMQFAIGSVVIVAAVFIAEGMPGPISTWGWMLLSYLTVVGSVLPFLLFYWLLRHVTSTKASLVGYVVPLVALVSGIVLIDEKLQLGIVVGGLLIIAGVVLTDRAERKRPAPLSV